MDEGFNSCLQCACVSKRTWVSVAGGQALAFVSVFGWPGGMSSSFLILPLRVTHIPLFEENPFLKMPPSFTASIPVKIQSSHPTLQHPNHCHMFSHIQANSHSLPPWGKSTFRGSGFYCRLKPGISSTAKTYANISYFIRQDNSRVVTIMYFQKASNTVNYNSVLIALLLTQ